MTHQIIQQPDGLLCVWSSVVDDFIITGATPEELIDYYAEEAAKEARKKAEEITAAVLTGRAQDVYRRTVMTYEEAVERVR